MAKDYYLILGIPATADSSEIRSAYRDLAKQHHPDSGGEVDRFREIREAYEVLSDPDRRSGYDRSRHRRNSSSYGWTQPGSAGSAFPSAFGRSPVDSASWYYRNSPGRPLREADRIQRFQLVLSPHEARTLASIPVPISVSVRCEACAGRGRVRGIPCPHCRTSGFATESIVARVPLPDSLRRGTVLEFLIQPPHGPEVVLQLYVRID